MWSPNLCFTRVDSWPFPQEGTNTELIADKSILAPDLGPVP